MFLDNIYNVQNDGDDDDDSKKGHLWEWILFLNVIHVCEKNAISAFFAFLSIFLNEFF